MMGTMPPVEHAPYKHEDSEEEKLPEILMQDEVKESAGYEYKASARRWYWPVVVDGVSLDEKGKAELLLSQKAELPFLMSAVMERACNLSCAHCLYGDEKSSRSLSKENHLAETILQMAQEMPLQDDVYKPKFMSCGRILRPWQLDVFKNIRDVRKDIELGVIDNGTYTNLLGDKWPEGFKFDWIDISIDGTKEHHNEQRGSTSAFENAMIGLEHARDVVKPPEEGGRVSSLLTLTKINAGDIEAVADMLLSHEDSKLPLADKLMVTMMSPTNEINKPLAVDKETFAVAWEGLKAISKKYPPIQDDQGKKTDRFELSLYRIEDLELFASILDKDVSERKFMEVFHKNPDRPNDAPRPSRNNIVAIFDGVRVSYLPLSIWAPEELLIEADAKYRVAYEGKFTLDEHRAHISKDGQDIAAYTVADLNKEIQYDAMIKPQEGVNQKTTFQRVYEKGVDHWWKHFGREKFEEEMEAFKRIRAKATEQGWIQPKV